MKKSITFEIFNDELEMAVEAVGTKPAQKRLRETLIRAKAREESPYSRTRTFRMSSGQVICLIFQLAEFTASSVRAAHTSAELEWEDPSRPPERELRKKLYYRADLVLSLQARLSRALGR
jgi:hypothetical protein